MQFPVSRRSAVAAAMALAVATPFVAHAQTSDTLLTGSAALSNIRVQLVDLDPTDGIAPSITFNNTGLVGATWDSGALSAPDAQIYHNALLPSSPISANTADGASALATSDRLQVGVSLSAKDLVERATNIADTGSGSWSSVNSAVSVGSNDLTKHDSYDSVDWGRFTLSPHTALVIRADFAASAKADLSTVKNLIDDTTYGYTLDAPQVGLDAQFFVGDVIYAAPDSTGANIGQTSVGSSFYAYAGSPLAFTGDSDQGTYEIPVTPLELSYMNLGDTAKESGVRTRIMLSGSAYLSMYKLQPDPIIVPPTDPIPVIPEPSTYALMGLGLAGLALAQRRARRPGR